MSDPPASGIQLVLHMCLVHDPGPRTQALRGVAVAGGSRPPSPFRLVPGAEVVARCKDGDPRGGAGEGTGWQREPGDPPRSMCPETLCPR